MINTNAYNNFFFIINQDININNYLNRLYHFLIISNKSFVLYFFSYLSL